MFLDPLLLLAVATATVSGPQIELITMGPGPELYSIWGHSAIRVRDPSRPPKMRDIVYNFGSVDFSGNFFGRMLRGQVDAYVSVSTYRATEKAYVGEDRTFLRRRLNLSSEEAKGVARSLSRFLTKKREFYRYHHFKDNCSTRVADEIDAALSGVVSKDARREMTTLSFRKLALGAIRHRPIYYVAIDVLITEGSDQPITAWQATFLPAVLDERLDATTRDGAPVVAEKVVVHESTSIYPDDRAWPWWYVYGLFLFPLCVVMIVRPRIGSIVWGVTAGLIATGVLLIWAVTNYDFTGTNWNVLIFPVSHFLFVRRAPWIGRYAAGHAALVILLLGLAALGVIGQSIGPGAVFAVIPSLVLAVRSGKMRTE